MKKIFTLAAAVLVSLAMSAETETVPKFNNNWTGTSINFSHDEGANGSSDQQKDGDAEKVTYIKFRTNKNGNTITLNVNEGYQVTGLSVRGYTNDSGTGVSLVSVKYDDQEAIEANIDFPLSEAGTTATYQNNTNVADSVIVLQMSTSGKQLMAIMTVTYSLGCQDPEFTIPADGNGYVGDPIDLAITSKNQSKPISFAIKLNGEDAEVGTDFSYKVSQGVVQAIPLKAGTFAITFSQATDGTYCAAEKTTTFVISEKVPVSTVTIEGPTEGQVGQTYTYTATTDVPATTYQWWLGSDKIEGATTNKLEYTPTAAGSYTFMCSASNEYNEDSKSSNSITIVVTDPADACGELIKATHVNKNTATVTGVLGGSADKNTQDNGKLGSNGHYFGVKLSAGKFQAGVVVTIVASLLNGGNTATIYADKGTTYLGTADFDVESLTATYTLENEAEWIYVYRTSSACNPNIEYISVNRSCEASDNNKIKSLTINGEAVEAVDGVYSYTVGASVNLAAAEVVYTLAHPKATATPASGFMVDVPNAGDPANTQVITVTAQNGSKANYTVSVTKSAQASTDATLSALTVDGYTLDPAFASDNYVYTITKAYGAANPEVSAINATPNDANAVAIISYSEDVFTITVTAEDKTTTLEYTIHILEAAAKKALLKVGFSNGVYGFIADGNINVPYLAGEAEPTFVSAEFWNPDGYPTAEMIDGKLVVTGIDGKKDEYTITYVALTPMAATYDEITFTEVPSYIYSVYGWAADKGVKFSKDVEDAENHRISEGKDRIYIALPVAKEVILTGGSAGARPVVITVNGKASSITSTPKKDETITIPLTATEGANLVAIESNGNNGDAGFTKIQLVEGLPTAIENTEAAVKAVKVVRDGQMMILKNGVLYNMQGAVVK